MKKWNTLTIEEKIEKLHRNDMIDTWNIMWLGIILLVVLYLLTNTGVLHV